MLYLVSQEIAVVGCVDESYSVDGLPGYPHRLLPRGTQEIKYHFQVKKRVCVPIDHVLVSLQDFMATCFFTAMHGNLNVQNC